MIKFVSIRQNLTLQQILQKIAAEIKRSIDDRGSLVADVLKRDVSEHFQSRYPGSKHYNPNKVKVDDKDSIDIDVPGITRAYNDLDIRAKNSKYLTIPLHRSAYGIPAKSFSDLFTIKSKNGNLLLARNNGGNLELMYALKDHVHQRKDETLMPRDEKLSDDISAALIRRIDKNIGAFIKNL